MRYLIYEREGKKLKHNILAVTERADRLLVGIHAAPKDVPGVGSVVYLSGLKPYEVTALDILNGHEEPHNIGVVVKIKEGFPS